MTLIDFKKFYYRYKGNENYALDNINLKIDKNKFILLAGETGSGKTSLIRSMNGLIPQFYAGYYKGSVNVDGKDTSKTSIANLSTVVGIVFQNPENQLVAMNVNHEIAFGMENLGFPKEKIREKIDEVATLTEIENILQKAPFEISGGEQQRVAIASILALEPKILILDEPTANLDPHFAKKIINLLKEIQEKKNITIIISEHRMDLVIPVVDEIILMQQGKILQHNTREKVINGEIFENININKPVIYSIFKELKSRDLIKNNIPSSISEALNFFKNHVSI